MADNPYVNKVTFNGDPVIDLTGDTAEAGDVLSGKSFHLRSGAPATGSLDPPDSGIYNIGTVDSQTTLSTIAGAIAAFGAAHKNISNQTGQFNMSTTNYPSDIPANATEWKYGVGYISARYIDSSGVVGAGEVIIYSYQTNKIALSGILDNAMLGWTIVDADGIATSLSGLDSRIKDKWETNYGSSTSPITSLASLPVNGGGYVIMASSLAPEGSSNTAWAFDKRGTSTRYVVTISRISSSASASANTYIGEMYDGTFMGWNRVKTNQTISTDTYTGTTNGYGFVISNVLTSKKIISAYSDQGPIVMWQYNGDWVFGIVDFTTNGIGIKANTALTVTYTYYE